MVLKWFQQLISFLHRDYKGCEKVKKKLTQIIVSIFSRSISNFLYPEAELKCPAPLTWISSVPKFFANISPFPMLTIGSLSEWNTKNFSLLDLMVFQEKGFPIKGLSESKFLIGLIPIGAATRKQALTLTLLVSKTRRRNAPPKLWPIRIVSCSRNHANCRQTLNQFSKV